MVEYTACEDLDFPGSELILRPDAPLLENCLVSSDDQETARQMYVLTSFLFMAAQSQRVAALACDWVRQSALWLIRPRFLHHFGGLALDFADSSGGVLHCIVT